MDVDEQHSVARIVAREVAQVHRAQRPVEQHAALGRRGGEDLLGRKRPALGVVARSSASKPWRLPRRAQ
jgi:hypothetical protein